MTDVDQATFKAPMKREKKKNDEASVSKQARRTERGQESDAEDISNESDFSDSSASICSQSEWKKSRSI